MMVRGRTLRRRQVRHQVVNVAVAQHLERRTVVHRLLRRRPERPALGFDVAGGDRRLVVRVDEIVAGVDELLLERHLPNGALALGVLYEVVAEVETRHAQAAKHRRHRRERADRAAQFDGLLIVHFGFGVTLTVVHADVEVAVVRGEVVVERGARVRRVVEAFALGERRALEAIAVDALFVVNQGRLLDTKLRPRSPWSSSRRNRPAGTRSTCQRRKIRLSLEIIVPGRSA